MKNAQEALEALEAAVIRVMSMTWVMNSVPTMMEDPESGLDSANRVGLAVEALGDRQLVRSFERWAESLRTSDPDSQDAIAELDARMEAFLQRLNKLMVESTVVANEADILLRKALKMDASEGLFGPSGWVPEHE